MSGNGNWKIGRQTVSSLKLIYWIADHVKKDEQTYRESSKAAPEIVPWAVVMDGIEADCTDSVGVT